ncbi:MAG: UDP-N-acetylmuramoyl-L-alanyl-D-glutamate--2,6-diaminopimelate ligase [Candidatus Dormibacteraeota bacterium]|nr:UDP-N-acetylmuramoyl-L-alanyl-D-glutamate--2,6-diaminopimelate ligase [Candidatus Dormibacteraeota bacterium]
MKLSELLQGVAVTEAPPADPEVTGVCYDSRRVRPGDCFVAIPGEHTDGHRYVETALRDGATVAVVQRHIATAWPQVVVADSRRALALISSAFFNHPTRAMVVIGVTGTDGKTTTTTMIQHMLLSSGRRAGSMSTVDIRFGAEISANDSRQTTLEALEIQEQLARMRDSGIQDVVIETSSHGLALQRVVGCDYDVAVFTNIAHEHLDFHRTIEAYREAKASLIDLTAQSAGKGLAKSAILNRDDPSYAYLVRRPIAQRLTYGVQLDADLKAQRVEASAQGLQVEATTPLGQLAFRLSVSGRWNAANALAAAATGIAVGLSLEEIQKGLESFRGVSGRMERVDLGQPFAVIIDYAHTPQSLEKVLRELRPVTSGKLIAVFGSAGDRDREKRPWMGEIAARLSDYAVFTNEDPREEDAGRILSEIAAGAEEVGWKDGVNYARIEDRLKGIAHAVSRAAPGDTILLAGKGHERSILVGRGKQPWDERAAAEAAIREFGA